MDLEANSETKKILVDLVNEMMISKEGEVYQFLGWELKTKKRFFSGKPYQVVHLLGVKMPDQIGTDYYRVWDSTSTSMISILERIQKDHERWKNVQKQMVEFGFSVLNPKKSESWRGVLLQENLLEA